VACSIEALRWEKNSRTSPVCASATGVGFVATPPMQGAATVPLHLSAAPQSCHQRPARGEEGCMRQPGCVLDGRF
jgi:hypothetical protein